MAEEKVNGGIFRIALAASIAVNITGVGTWLMFGKQTMTRQEITVAIENGVKRAPFPWVKHEALVLDHMTREDIHETEKEKLSRVRRETENLKAEMKHEIRNALVPINEQLRVIRQDINQIKKQIMP